MTTALMLQLYPGIERITGGGIAGGIDPSLRVGMQDSSAFCDSCQPFFSKQFRFNYCPYYFVLPTQVT